MIERAERKPRIPSGRGRGKPLRRAVATIVTVATIAFATMAASLVVSCAASPKPAPAPLPAPEPSKPNLADLIAAGNLNGIKTFFASQDQLNTPDDQGSYPLHRAVEIGSAKTVELLLALGAKPEVKDKAGLSPLRLAIDKGANDCVKVLADKGADIFSADRTGVTVLEAALAKGGDVLSAVFNAANVNAKGPDGETALHMAADRLLEDPCARLLAAGADPGLRDGSGRTALDVALLHPDRVEAARLAELLVLKGGTTSFPDFTWFTLAARSLNYDSLRYEDGSTPLHQAVEHRQKGFVEFLLERKVNPNAHNGAGSAPLHEAVREGWLEGTEMLLKAGADPNVRDGFDNTPLHIVMPEKDRGAAVALLLEHGADPSLKDRNGNTPLHVAAQVGYPIEVLRRPHRREGPGQRAERGRGYAAPHYAQGEAIRLREVLLDSGADIFLVNGVGESPLSIAVCDRPRRSRRGAHPLERPRPRRPWRRPSRDRHKSPGGPRRGGDDHREGLGRECAQ